MLKDETPLLEVYYAQHIADSMGCSQQQKDVIISKSLLEMLERLAMPLNSYGLDLTEHGISSEVLREKVLAEHRKYLSLLNRDITASLKTAPQDMSDGEKLLRIYWSLIRANWYCWMSGEPGVPLARRL